jgi:hypothetical protein
MSWYAYCIYAIEDDWDLNMSIDEFREKKGSKAYLWNFEDHWDMAQEAARQVGFEGEITAGPVVFLIPDEPFFHYAFAFSHQRNGETFIISPIPLKHLERQIVRYKVIKQETLDKFIGPKDPPPIPKPRPRNNPKPKAKPKKKAKKRAKRGSNVHSRKQISTK